MRHQRTLAGVVGTEGISLHSGESVSVIINPAPEGSGIRFLRTDLDDATIIHAHASHVTDTFYATTLSVDGVSVSTVEHLMAALFAMGITNAEIHVKGAEVPILDGSSREWVSLIKQVGIHEQRQWALPELVIKKPVGVKSKNQFATLYPHNGFAVDCTIDFDHPMIGHQRWEGEVDETVFLKELADARTFGMVSDARKLRRKGRARGASVDNVIVLDETRVISEGGLRYKDEFVRHKVLDAIGDLSLLGLNIRGLLVTNRSGHKLHQQLVRMLLDSRDCWEFSGLPHAQEEKVVAQVKRLVSLMP